MKSLKNIARLVLAAGTIACLAACGPDSKNQDLSGLAGNNPVKISVLNGASRGHLLAGLVNKSDDYDCRVNHDVLNCLKGHMYPSDSKDSFANGELYQKTFNTSGEVYAHAFLLDPTDKSIIIYHNSSELINSANQPAETNIYLGAFNN